MVVFVLVYTLLEFKEVQRCIGNGSAETEEAKGPHVNSNLIHR